MKFGHLVVYQTKHCGYATIILVCICLGFRFLGAFYASTQLASYWISNSHSAAAGGVQRVVTLRVFEIKSCEMRTECSITLKMKHRH